MRIPLASLPLPLFILLREALAEPVRTCLLDANDRFGHLRAQCPAGLPATVEEGNATSAVCLSPYPGLNTQELNYTCATIINGSVSTSAAENVNVSSQGQGDGVEPREAETGLLSFEEWKEKQVRELEASLQLRSEAAEKEKDLNGRIEDALRAQEQDRRKDRDAVNGSTPQTSINAQGNDKPSSAAAKSISGSNGATIPRPTAQSHRYNYASPDCSARIHSASKYSSNPSSVLHKSKDRYMLTPCSAKEHWVVIELCDDIRIEAIELGMFEFFSGVVREVDISVGGAEEDGTEEEDQQIDEEGNLIEIKREWTSVGRFTSKNVRGSQSFSLSSPTSFHRFVRLEFPTYYGKEYYCPISSVKVYGMNQMEAYKWQERRRRHEEDEQRRRATMTTVASVVASATPVHSAQASTSGEAKQEAVTVSERITNNITLADAPSATAGTPESSSLVTATSSPTSAEIEASSATNSATPELGSEQASSMTSNGAGSITIACATPSARIDGIATTLRDAESALEPISATGLPVPVGDSAVGTPSTSSGVMKTSAVTSTAIPLPTTRSSEERSNAVHSAAAEAAAMSSTSDIRVSVLQGTSSSASSSSQSPVAPPSHTQAYRQPPRADSSESIYAYIIRRLDALEGNTTLATLYIEQQTRSTQAMLTRLEQSLESWRVSSAAEMNRTIEAERLRMDKKLNQVLARVQQKEALSERERLALKTQLRGLADDILFEKRRGIAQLIFTLVLVIVGAVTQAKQLDKPLGPGSSRSKGDGSALPALTVPRGQDLQQAFFEDAEYSGQNLDGMDSPLQSVRLRSPSRTPKKQPNTLPPKPWPRQTPGGRRLDGDAVAPDRQRMRFSSGIGIIPPRKMGRSAHLHYLDGDKARRQERGDSIPVTKSPVSLPMVFGKDDGGEVPAAYEEMTPVVRSPARWETVPDAAYPDEGAASASEIDSDFQTDDERSHMGET